MDPVASCRVCTKTASLTDGICEHCLSAYGKRTAVFLARAQVDPAFVNATLGRLDPVARERLLAVVSQHYMTAKPGLRKAAPRTEASHRRASG